MKLHFTIRDIFWLIIVIALVVAWRIDRSRAPQWEYKFKIINNDNEEAEMERLGAEGWEGWAYDRHNPQSNVYFKRQKR